MISWNVAQIPANRALQTLLLLKCQHPPWKPMNFWGNRVLIKKNSCHHDRCALSKTLGENWGDGSHLDDVDDSASGWSINTVGEAYQGLECPGSGLGISWSSSSWEDQEKALFSVWQCNDGDHWVFKWCGLLYSSCRDHCVCCTL